MENEDLIKELTTTSERAKSNTHLIEDFKKEVKGNLEELKDEIKEIKQDQKAIYSIATSVEILAKDVGSIKKSVEEVNQKVDKVDEKVNAVDEKGKFDWTNLITEKIIPVLIAIGAGIATYLVTK